MKQNIDLKNGGMYFLVFLGIQYIVQWLLPTIYSFIFSFFPRDFNALSQNLLSYAIFLIFLILSIIFSLNTLRNFWKITNTKAVILTATLLYGVYLFVYQLQTFLTDILSGIVFGNYLFYLQLLFLIINLIVFYFVSLKYVKEDVK